VHLIEGQTVLNAFEEAKSAAIMGNSQSCCCAHAHDDKCIWYKYAQEHGYEKAHEKHAGECKCNLDGGKHLKNCSRLIKFNEFLLEQSESTKKKEEKPPSSNMMDAFEFADDFDFDNFEKGMIAKDEKVEHNIICCCKPEVPHDEEMKFCVKGTDNDKKMKIFWKTMRGDVE